MKKKILPLYGYEFSHKELLELRFQRDFDEPRDGSFGEDCPDDAFDADSSLISATAINCTGTLVAVAVGATVVLLDTKTSTRTTEIRLVTDDYRDRGNEDFGGVVGVEDPEIVISQLEFSLNGEHLVASVSISWDNCVVRGWIAIIDWRNARVLPQALNVEALEQDSPQLFDQPYDFWLTPDCERVVVGAHPWEVKVFDATTGEQTSRKIGSLGHFMCESFGLKLYQTARQTLLDLNLSPAQIEDSAVDFPTCYCSLRLDSDQNRGAVVLRIGPHPFYVLCVVSLREPEPVIGKITAFRRAPNTRWLGFDENSNQALFVRSRDKNRECSATLVYVDVDSGDTAESPLAGKFQTTVTEPANTSVSPNVRWLVQTCRGAILVYQLGATGKAD